MSINSQVEEMKNKLAQANQMIKSATPQRSEDHLAVDRIKRQISQAERMVQKASREL